MQDAAATFASAGMTPFGFDFDKRGNLLVSEAGGTASSYDVSREGRVNVISGAVATFQAAPCWLVTSKDGKYAYTANTGSGTVSGFTVGDDGSLELLTPGGVTASTGAARVADESFTREGRYLYVRSGGTNDISGFAIGKDGSLTHVETMPGLPVGAAGLAASDWDPHAVPEADGGAPARPVSLLSVPGLS